MKFRRNYLLPFDCSEADIVLLNDRRIKRIEIQKQNDRVIMFAWVRVAAGGERRMQGLARCWRAIEVILCSHMLWFLLNSTERQVNPLPFGAQSLLLKCPWQN